jgi:hypothetical protein
MSLFIDALFWWNNNKFGVSATVAIGRGDG